MREIWLPVAGYGNAYSVSNLGRVMRTSPRNVPRLLTKSRAKPFVPSECRAFINRDGYPQVRIGPAGGQTTVCVHRLVARAFLPNPQNLRDVNHKDGDKENNRLDNLEWVTHQSNMRHAVDRGLQPVARGVAHARAKLTDADIRAIRADPRIGRLIGADYGVAQTTVSLIKLRRAWAHVK